MVDSLLPLRDNTREAALEGAAKAFQNLFGLEVGVEDFRLEYLDQELGQYGLYAGDQRRVLVEIRNRADEPGGQRWAMVGWVSCSSPEGLEGLGV